MSTNVYIYFTPFHDCIQTICKICDSKEVYISTHTCKNPQKNSLNFRYKQWSHTLLISLPFCQFHILKKQRKDAFLIHTLQASYSNLIRILNTGKRLQHFKNSKKFLSVWKCSNWFSNLANYCEQVGNAPWW